MVNLPKVTENRLPDLRRMLASEWTGGNVDPASIYGRRSMDIFCGKKLFGTQADLRHLSDKHLRAISYSMVKAKRLPHIKGTEETAVALASSGVWTRKRPAGRRSFTTAPSIGTWRLRWRPVTSMGLRWMNWSGFRSSSSTPRPELPWPSMCLGEPDDVYDAIFCHTTGKPGMTKLDKVLYLADYMEPSRALTGWRSCAVWFGRTWTRL